MATRRIRRLRREPRHMGVVVIRGRRHLRNDRRHGVNARRGGDVAAGRCIKIGCRDGVAVLNAQLIGRRRAADERDRTFEQSRMRRLEQRDRRAIGA